MATALAVGWAQAEAADPVRGLRPTQLAVIVNTSDPLSEAIGGYYVQRRGIPSSNVARVSFGRDRSVMPAAEFERLKASVDRQLPPGIQAYALTWVRPYRVDCMSMTAAFAFGFDSAFCAVGCVATQLSRYYNSSSERPYDDLQMRPTMSLAALDLAHARSLIDRGVDSDGTAPSGTAYLLSSGDAARDVRVAGYADAQALVGRSLRIEMLHDSGLRARNDVMFYFIGAAQVPDMTSNRFLPGSVGDHLTSYGGELTAGPQMSSIRWLEAGAAGSYGTVVEPCNFTAKFPSPALLMHYYLSGETLVEAYWKSVAMPGQGVFIGEPLAAPYRPR